MGGVILLFMVALVVVILITPALRERERKRRDRDVETVHEAVVRRLDDHRRGTRPPTDEPGDEER